MPVRLRDPRLLLLVSAALLGAAIAFPLGVIASHQFTDVPNSNTFHADIDAIRDAGVTTGCAANLYCPKDFVTREQMAAFLNRLGALGAGKTPVVNATKLDGLDSTGFMPAGDIEIRQIGTWYPSYDTGQTIERHHNYEATDAESGMFARLDGPVSVGRQAYGIKSVEVCYTIVSNNQDADAHIVDTTVIAYTPATSSTLIQDSTDHHALFGDPAACYSVSDATPNEFVGSAVLELFFQFGSFDTSMGIGAVTTTWTPVD